MKVTNRVDAYLITIEEPLNKMAMQTIRLRVNEKVYQNLMWFLRKFTKEELEIIEEDGVFSATQKELKQDLAQLENGEAEFLDIDQLDQELENTIKRYEA